MSTSTNDHMNANDNNAIADLYLEDDIKQSETDTLALNNVVTTKASPEETRNVESDSVQETHDVKIKTEDLARPDQNIVVKESDNYGSHTVDEDSCTTIEKWAQESRHSRHAQRLNPATAFQDEIVAVSIDENDNMM